MEHKWQAGGGRAGRSEVTRTCVEATADEGKIHKYLYGSWIKGSREAEGKGKVWDWTE